MKNRCYVGGLLASAFLVALIAISDVPSIKEATAQGPVTLTLYNPTGAFEVSQTFAPRLADLNGKKICEISDHQWEAERTFPLIRELLQRQFPTATFIPYTKFPYGKTPEGSYAMDVDNIGKLAKAAGCDAVISGNAG
jgi:hypothetical protein